MNERRFQIENEMQRARLKQFLDRRELPFQVEIGPLKEPRSLSQNARLWALHELAAKHIGCGKEDIHEDMLCEFSGVKAVVRLPSGNEKRIPNERSSDMNKKRFASFMEFVETFYISEFGVWLDQEAA